MAAAAIAAAGIADEREIEIGNDARRRQRGEIEDDGFGDYSTGRYCWELTDVQVFDPAIPAKGGREWWNWHNL
jgi:hypothetical protein